MYSLFVGLTQIFHLISSSSHFCLFVYSHFSFRLCAFTFNISLNIRSLELRLYSFLAIPCILFHVIFCRRASRIAYVWDPVPLLISVLKLFRYRIVLDVCMTPSLSSYIKSKSHPLFYQDSVTTLDSANLELSYISRFDKIISPSFYTTDFLLSNIPSPAPSISTIPFGVDLDYFSSIELVKVDSSPLRFGYVGVINMRKGIHHLIHALNLLFDQESVGLQRFELILFGRVHPLTQPFLKEARFPITIHPFTRDKRKIFSSFDILIHPSFIEGSAKCIYEALASARPVICTFESGPALTDAPSVLTYPSGDTQKLISCISYFLYSKSRIHYASNKSRNLIQSFTWNSYSSQVTNVLKNM